MFGERQGGKGYHSGGQEKDWLGCLKNRVKQQKPNRTTHQNTTHDTRHALHLLV